VSQYFVSVAAPVPSASRDAVGGVSLFSGDAAGATSQAILQREQEQEQREQEQEQRRRQEEAAAAAAVAALEMEVAAARVAVEQEAARLAVAEAEASERAQLVQLMSDVIDAVE
jgi:hypothetical protein